MNAILDRSPVTTIPDNGKTMASSETVIKRLIVAAAISTVAFFVLLVLSVCSSEPPTDPAMTERRILPLDKVAINAGSTDEASDALSAESIVKTRCIACHGSGIGGAPKLGDKKDWAPRISTGFDAMARIALTGKGAMPPKGGFPDLTDEQIRDAVRWMANSAGANIPSKTSNS